MLEYWETSMQRIYQKKSRYIPFNIGGFFVLGFIIIFILGTISIHPMVLAFLE